MRKPFSTWMAVWAFAVAGSAALAQSNDDPFQWLEDVQGEGISGIVYVGAGGSELPVPCYPPDAIALALRAGIPIYATPDALGYAEVTAIPGFGADGPEADGYLAARPLRPGCYLFKVLADSL